jgi:hypothetical protein
MLEHAARQHRGAPTSQQQETNLPVQLSELPIWEVIRDIMKHVPDEVVDLLPNDGASQVDHCIYGLPKIDQCIASSPIPSTGLRSFIARTPVTKPYCGWRGGVASMTRWLRMRWILRTISSTERPRAGGRLIVGH